MYALIIIPILVALVAQIIKLIIDGIPNNLDWQHLFSDYGGLPSSHAALVASLLTIVGLVSGIDSVAFAIAFILLVVVVRDAVGFRREIGKNAVLTNTIAREIFPENPEVLVRERIGHTPLEALAGLVLGSALTFLFYWLMLVM
ncbi:MAG: divergent PAP2 family protein [Patescibacteria group bacterium]